MRGGGGCPSALSLSVLLVTTWSAVTVLPLSELKLSAILTQRRLHEVAVTGGGGLDMKLPVSGSESSFDYTGSAE